jgi:pimeloyl-ACP methyl ester carboxylesterase
MPQWQVTLPRDRERRPDFARRVVRSRTAFIWLSGGNSGTHLSSRRPTLVLASEKDFWSRPEDRDHLAEDLAHAPRVKVVVIPGATHFVHRCLGCKTSNTVPAKLQAIRVGRIYFLGSRCGGSTS